MRFARYNCLGDSHYVERHEYPKSTIDALVRNGFLQKQRVVGNNVFLTPVGQDARNAIHFTCVKCGLATTVACSNGHSHCPDHCPDHEYEYDTSVEWWVCIQCNGIAPNDYFEDQPEPHQ